MKPRVPLPVPLDAQPFTSAEAFAAGLGRERLRGTDLERPFQGVYLPIGSDADVQSRCLGLSKRIAPEAFFCTITAAQLMSVPLPWRHQDSAIVHVGVFAPCEPPSGRGIRGHEYELDESDIDTCSGLRITSPEETWCSLGAQLTVPELVAAGDYLIHWRSPITTIDKLRDRVKKWAGHRGVKKLRLALALLNERSESPQESVLRVIIVDAGIPGLAVNYPVRTSGGFDYRADLAFPERKVILEYQSAFHETPESFRADMTRISRLEADGWKVIQINRDDLRNPDELIARIRQVLATRPHF